MCFCVTKIEYLYKRVQLSAPTMSSLPAPLPKELTERSLSPSPPTPVKTDPKELARRRLLNWPNPFCDWLRRDGYIELYEDAAIEIVKRHLYCALVRQWKLKTKARRNRLVTAVECTPIDNPQGPSQIAILCGVKLNPGLKLSGNLVQGDALHPADRTDPKTPLDELCERPSWWMCPENGITKDTIGEMSVDFLLYLLAGLSYPGHPQISPVDPNKWPKTICSWIIECLKQKEPKLAALMDFAKREVIDPMIDGAMVFNGAIAELWKEYK